ncbi:MAG: STAS/SEC14 domain-containing protein [Chloroflexi bacterium]|nr:STAS/SEC14 domain-containing protein [Chloroflexota bacterium]
MNLQTKHTRISTVTLREDGIMHVKIAAGAEESLEDAQATLRACGELARGRRYPILVDIRQMQAQDRDARQVYGSPEAAQIGTAAALVVESRVSKLIANFFLVIVKSSVPTKLFTDEAEAIAWLRGYQE